MMSADAITEVPFPNHRMKHLSAHLPSNMMELEGKMARCVRLGCSCRGPGLSSQHTHGGSQTPGTLVLASEGTHIHKTKIKGEGRKSTQTILEDRVAQVNEPGTKAKYWLRAIVHRFGGQSQETEGSQRWRPAWSTLSPGQPDLHREARAAKAVH